MLVPHGGGLRGRDAPRDLRPRLLQLARSVARGPASPPEAPALRRAAAGTPGAGRRRRRRRDRKSTRLNSSHSQISYAVFCLKKKNNNKRNNVLYSSRITQHPARPL